MNAPADVLTEPADLAPGAAPRVPAGTDLLAARIAGLSMSAPYAVPKRRPGPDFVNLVNGAPAAEALPFAEIRQTTDALFADPALGAQALEYGPNAGEAVLRQLIAQREGVATDRILITNGGLHGTALVLHALTGPGDTVAVDDPVFPDTVRIIEHTGAAIHPVPHACAGLDVDVLADRLRAGLRPKAVYTVPDFHNPAGTVLPASRRARLVELADHYGFVVLSDNPYRHLSFDGGYEPDFPSDNDRVVVINTFTKTLGPGFRLGWLVLPEWLAPHVVNLRRRYDFQSATLSQAIIRTLLQRPGWYDDLLVRAREVYRRRGRAAIEALSPFRDRLDFHAPEGGFFIWVRLKGGEQAARTLADMAQERGVVYSVGTFYDPLQSGRYADHFRISYSASEWPHLQAGLSRLAETIRTLSD